MAINVKLADYQNDFINLGGIKAMIGGYGAGKSYTEAHQILWYMFKYPQKPGLIMSVKTSLLMKTIVDPLFDMLRRYKIPFRKNEQLKTIYVSLLPGKETEIYWETYNNYKEMVGVNCAWAVLDEIDVTPYAYEVWEKVIGRVRIGRETDITVATTPEGFYFSYDFFSPDGQHYCEKDNYKYVSVDSRLNRHVSRDSLMKRLSIYTKEQINAYVRGKWANLINGSVFYEFDQKAHIKPFEYLTNFDPENIEEHLIVGMDFNRSFMVSVLYLQKNNALYGVDEIVLQNNASTRDMAGIIKRKYPRCNFTIYPDGSARNESTSNAGDSDLKQLQRVFGESNVVCRYNPLVEDRYSIANYALKDGRVFYFPVCKYTIRDFQKVVRDASGRINKRELEKNQLTHASDAATYPIYHIYKNVYADLLRDDLYATA